MIAVEEAEKHVFGHLMRCKAKEVAVDDALGCILHEDIVADRDLPPFNRVMMDGIAIDHHAWQQGVRKFKVEGMQTAGAPQMVLKNHTDSCLEVMTGAVMPQNTDVVVRYEDVEFIEKDLVKLKIDEVLPFQNIHLQGTDRKRRDVLIKAGKIISPAEIAIMATVGKSAVKVVSHPEVALVSTGDELVNIEETPHPYQVRKSNIHALKASLREMGFPTKSYHFTDEHRAVEEGLKSVFKNHDVVVLSGGVSKGKKDYVPEVLELLGVKKLFHRVKQRPGKPFWFGIRAEDDKTVFALPGNPVSTFMCFYKYVKPWLHQSAGLIPKKERAVLAEDFDFAADLTYFLQVKVSVNDKGVLQAIPVKGQGSGDLANLLEADAFLELPPDRQHFKHGETFSLLYYR
ncbi:MAG: molybdopterin molybdotransferase MoeA [Fulvivirga sp.]|nr:molybdopterin molybdotransferase MoeA [Fulvivirga sp.]